MEPPQTAPVPPATPVETPPSPTHSPSKLPWILGGLVLLVLVGTGGVFLGTQMARPIVPEAVAPTPTEVADPTSNWQTYTNPPYAFSVKFPSTFEFYETKWGTNLTNVQIVVNKTQKDNFAFKASKSAKTGDDKLYNDVSSTSTLTIDGVVWQVLQTNIGIGGPAAPGESIPVYILQTIKNNNLYSIEFYNSESLTALQSQILSTFKFTDTSTNVEPTSKPLASVPLMDTTGWATGNVANVSFKYPTDYAPKQYQTSIDLIKPTQYGANTISFNVYTYDGGSRRQWYIDRLYTDGGESYENLEKYTLAKEVKLGTVDALDFWMDAGWWQGGYTSPIIIASGKTIVTITPSTGRRNDPTTGISRLEILDTIGSTVKFN